MKPRMVTNTGDNTLANILLDEIKSGAKISIASAYFSLYAYDALKEVLDEVDNFRFVFTEPTFIKQEAELKRQYKWRKKTKETSYPKFDSNEYEIQLSNQMTSQAIAQNVVDWINENAQFKSIKGDVEFPKQLLVENKDTNSNVALQSEIKFTADGLGVTPSNRAAAYTVFTEANSLTDFYLNDFNQLWENPDLVEDITEEVIEQVELIYQENSPQWLYFVTLYHIFQDQLDDLDEDKVIKPGTNFKDTKIWNTLYPFQRDGVVGLIDKIEKHDGCILADSVGLGKTFSALAVIKYYELRNDRVLVLAPKKLRDNWTVYTQNDKRNILIEDRFNYDVLNHTDLSRESGFSGEINLSTINWGNYDLVVIDESHNFRNNNPHKNRLTRYQKLMQDIIQSGVKNKVLLLSATPVNNKMNDIKNQIAFITEDQDDALADVGVESLDRSLAAAQQAYNRWSELDPETRTTEHFLDMVNPEYFQILDTLTIARSREHIEKYYNIDDIGEFPTRRKPKSIKADIDSHGEFPSMEQIYQSLGDLTFSAYQPMAYILPSKRKHYENLYDTQTSAGSTFKQSHREQALVGLMRVNMLKRLESSVHSFSLTLERQVEKYRNLISKLKEEVIFVSETELDSLETDEADVESLTVGTDKVQIKLQDIDKIKWLGDLGADMNILLSILQQAKSVTSNRDEKLHTLKNEIRQKINHPINPGNKKILIFSAFADTIDYLYQELAPILEDEGIYSAQLTGGMGNNKTTLPGMNGSDFNDILINFSPQSKNRDEVYPNQESEIDILFATDVISEGQNLQDCDYVINYDIHWNPVRVIQRFGRIDRIGSTNKEIQLVNFWPNMELDEYINLEDRVRGRMVILSTSATGEENILDSKQEGMNDLTYRRNQLKALQEEVVNLEDVSGGISITDLTYTEFKTDLTNALKHHEDTLAKAPKGMYALTQTDPSNPEIVPGVIFCFRQMADFDIENNNLTPYFLLYVNRFGEAKLNYTNSKKILDIYRRVSLGQDDVLEELVEEFNQETNYGQNMELYTDLLHQSMNIVTNVQEENFLDSFFTPGGTAIQESLDLGYDDLELISFLIIKEAKNE